MSKLTTATKRLLVGRPFRSDRLAHTLLPKRIALPVFASDALSSVAYAPREIFATLSVAGLAAYAYAPVDRRSGRPGDDRGRAVLPAERARLSQWRRRLRGRHQEPGPTYGLLVASALLVDYILTVAVSTAAGVANIGSAIKIVGDHPVLVLRGRSSCWSARPTCAASGNPGWPSPSRSTRSSSRIFVMIITGLVEFFDRRRRQAQSASFHLQAESLADRFGPGLPAAARLSPPVRPR